MDVENTKQGGWESQGSQFFCPYDLSAFFPLSWTTWS